MVHLENLLCFHYRPLFDDKSGSFSQTWPSPHTKLLQGGHFEGTDPTLYGGGGGGGGGAAKERWNCQKRPSVPLLLTRIVVYQQRMIAALFHPEVLASQEHHFQKLLKFQIRIPFYCCFARCAVIHSGWKKILHSQVDGCWVGGIRIWRHFRIGQCSSPWPCNSVKLEMKFHLECKLNFPSCGHNLCCDKWV